MRKQTSPGFSVAHYLWAIVMAFSSLILAYIILVKFDVPNLPWALDDRGVLFASTLSIFLIGLCVTFYPPKKSAMAECKVRRGWIEETHGFTKNEELNFSSVIVESGEIIHSVGNLLADEKATIGTLSINDGKALQELGTHLVAAKSSRNTLSHPTLLANGFNPLLHEDIVILGIAHRLIGNGGVVSFQDAVNSELAQKEINNK